jgi:hypothetical protein
MPEEASRPVMLDCQDGFTDMGQFPGDKTGLTRPAKRLGEPGRSRFASGGSGGNAAFAAHP